METVRRLTDDLLDVLGRELNLVRELSEFARRKESCLGASEPDCLNELLGQEEELVLELRRREDERRGKAEALAGALGESGRETQLRTLAGYLPDPALRKKLLNAGRELSTAVRQLSLRNVRLREHLNQRMNYASFMLNLLYAPPGRGQLYNVQGAKEDGPAGLNVLDYHA